MQRYTVDVRLRMWRVLTYWCIPRLQVCRANYGKADSISCFVTPTMGREILITNLASLQRQSPCSLFGSYPWQVGRMSDYVKDVPWLLIHVDSMSKVQSMSLHVSVGWFVSLVSCDLQWLLCRLPESWTASWKSQETRRFARTWRGFMWLRYVKLPSKSTCLIWLFISR